MRLVIGISGASGVIYGIRLLEVLQADDAIETHLVMTSTARMNIPLETDYKVKDVEQLASVVHGINEVGASIASGSFKTDGMIIAPCSMKMLSAIAHSFADNLLVRAADVTLKEGRKLVVMPRESPLHTGHCRLLAQASEIGVHIVPPMPVFYTRPETIDDLVNQTVGRTLDLFSLNLNLVKRWEGTGR